MSRDDPPDRRPLFERLRPRRWGDLVGDRRTLDRVASWALSWAESDRPPRYRALLVSGPPGVGKTTLAGVVASTYAWTVVEMNASEARNQSAVEVVAGRASLSRTLGGGDFRSPREGGRALILIDEADSMAGRAGSASSASRASPPSFREFLSGRYREVGSLAAAWRLGAPDRPPAFENWSEVPTTAGRAAWTKLPEAQRDISDWREASAPPADRSDRGGYAALVKLVRETRQPVLITANDSRELFRRAPALRPLVASVEIGPIDPAAMRAFLKRVVQSERIALAPSTLEQIVQHSHGDLRAAINDLEAVAPLPAGPLREVVLSTRDTTTELIEFVGEVLREPRFRRAGEILDRLDTSPEELWPWFEENLPHFAPSPRGLDRAMATLADAELLVARARRQRVYALWPFANEELTGGTSLALSADAPSRPARVNFPEFLAWMGQSRTARSLRDSALSKTGRTLHLSRRKATENEAPWLTEMLPRGTQGAAVAAELELTAEESRLFGGPEPPVEPGVEEPPLPASPPPEPPAPATPPPPSRRVQKRLGEFP